MDVDPPVPPSSTSKKASKSPKKPKFTPKPPVKRNRTLVLSKSDSSENSESDQELIRTAIERLEGVPKVEKKSSDNATESQGAGSSSTHDPMKKDGNSKTLSNFKQTPRRSVRLSSLAATKNEDIDLMVVDDESESGSASGSEHEYKEPWDPNSYYPISLPARPPGSGDPEVLNAEEFGKQNEYEETKINHATKLGLSGPNTDDKKKFILFQLPEQLPLDQVPVGSSSSLKEDGSKKSFGLKDLPNGHMGKMLVYKSGAIKLKIGDTIFDVSSGTPCTCDQSAVVMNTKSKDCCVLGTVNKRATVTPDLSSILDNINLV